MEAGISIDKEALSIIEVVGTGLFPAGSAGIKDQQGQRSSQQEQRDKH